MLANHPPLKQLKSNSKSVISYSHAISRSAVALLREDIHTNDFGQGPCASSESSVLHGGS